MIGIWHACLLARCCASPLDDQIIGYFVWSNDSVGLLAFPADLIDSYALNDCMLVKK